MAKYQLRVVRDNYFRWWYVEVFLKYVFNNTVLFLFEHFPHPMNPSLCVWTTLRCSPCAGSSLKRAHNWLLSKCTPLRGVRVGALSEDAPAPSGPHQPQHITLDEPSLTCSANILCFSTYYFTYFTHTRFQLSWYWLSDIKYDKYNDKSPMISLHQLCIHCCHITRWYPHALIQEVRAPLLLLHCWVSND